MEDDLIACLYPYQDDDNNVRSLINDTANSPWCVDDDCRSPVPQGRESRESTAPPDDEYKEKFQSNRAGSRLELRFSHKLKGGLGIVFGTDRNRCDIVLPHISGISRKHFFITFDEHRRLMVRDISRHGSIVTYDEKGKHRRSNFKWIIGGHHLLDQVETIVFEIHPALKFRIVVSKQLRIDNIDRFRQEVDMNDELPLGALGIQSAITTAAPSGRHTPKQTSILLEQKKLGQGSFGVVTHVWDVSTGLEYASKKCLKPHALDWRREADVMRNTSHDHIVKLYSTLDAPDPQLLLEYLPLGNLEYQHRVQPISKRDVLTLLCQSASALSYLHGQTPPIAHRDIKPENILVESRSPFHIKLSDFGLSKAGSYLETRCGTLYYAAPEIVQYQQTNSTGSHRYKCAVDIWSLGVVIFEYGYGLPRKLQNSRLSWCEQIVRGLKSCALDKSLDILPHMLAITPRMRYSAEECYNIARKIEGSLTPIPLPAERWPREIIQPNPTPINPTASDQDDYSFRDSEIDRYIRTQIPLPPGTPGPKGDVRQHTSPRSGRVSKVDRYSKTQTPLRPGSLGSKGDILQQVSSQSIRDSEIQGYIRSNVAPPSQSGAPARGDSFDPRTAGHHPSVAPTVVDQRKRSTPTSSSHFTDYDRTITKRELSRLLREQST